MGKTLPNQQQSQPPKRGCKPAVAIALAITSIFFGLVCGAIFSFCVFVVFSTPSDRLTFIIGIIGLILSMGGITFSILALLAALGQWLVSPKFVYDKFPVLQQLFTEIEASLTTNVSVSEERQLLGVPSKKLLMHFIGRETFLNELEERFKTNPRQTIGGLKCVGKSIVALAHAHNRDSHKVVIWLNASKPEKLGESCREALKQREQRKSAATQSSAPGSSYPLIQPQPSDLSSIDQMSDNTAIEKVKQWLEQEPNWFLVLDRYRATEARVFLDLHLEEKKQILITTDLSHVYGTHYETLPPLSREDATVLFLRHAGRLKPDQHLEMGNHHHVLLEKATDIVEKFGHSSLAIVHAGIHTHHGGCCSFTDFLDNYHKEPGHFFTEPLDTHQFIDEDHKTLKEAYEEAWQNIDNDALNLLRVCAFFAPAPVSIPYKLLQKSAEAIPELSTIFGSSFQRMAGNLRNLALVEYNDDKQILTVPTSVQEIIRSHTYVYGGRVPLLKCAESVVKIVSDCFPQAEVSQWETCHSYLPHAQACCRHIEKYNFAFPEAIALLHNTACYLLACEKYAEAEHLLKEALRLSSSTSLLLPKIHISLGELYHTQGMFVQAKEQFEQAASTSNEDEITRLSHLGQLEDDLGNYQQATDNYNKAQKRIDSAPDKNALQVQQAILLNNLGCLQMKQAKAEGEQAKKSSLEEQARKSFLKALGFFNAHLGKNHPDTLECRANLSTLFIVSEPPIITLTPELKHVRVSIPGPNGTSTEVDWDVQKDYQAILSIGLGTIGIQRLQIANAHSKLAELYRMTGSNSKAKEQYKLALNIYETRCPNHPNRAIVLRNYAIFLQQTEPDQSNTAAKNYQSEAERIFQKYLEQVNMKNLLVEQPQPPTNSPSTRHKSSALTQ